VCQTYGDDLTEGIGKRDFVPYDRGKRQSTYKENQDELKGSHLLARSPSYEANNHDQKQVTEKCPQNRSHRN
jgi:hypothetical protein